MTILFVYDNLFLFFERMFFLCSEKENLFFSLHFNGLEVKKFSLDKYTIKYQNFTLRHG